MASELTWDQREDPSIIPGRGAVRTNPKRKDRTGAEGENLTAARLQKSGWRILERNLVLPSCEIDIIAREKSTLVFVEVKTRRTETHTDPYAEVPPERQARMKRAKREYLRWKALPSDIPSRFDIVMVLMPEGKDPEFRHIRDAF